MKKLTPWMALIVGAALLAGCSSANGGKVARTVEITAANMAFEPKEITIKKGETSRILLKNSDGLAHDFTVIKFQGKSQVVSDTGGHGGHGADMQTHVSAAAGKSGTLDITPADAGEYQVICTVTGHKEAGMVAKLIVE